MEIRFVDRSQQLTAALRDRGERSLLFALSRFGDQLQHVTVYTDDVNGPRGGVDKRCLMRAKLRRKGTVEVVQAGSNLGHCLSLAASRLGRTVRRQIDARRQIDRRSIRRSEAFVRPS